MSALVILAVVLILVAVSILAWSGVTLLKVSRQRRRTELARARRCIRPARNV